MAYGASVGTKPLFARLHLWTKMTHLIAAALLLFAPASQQRPKVEIVIENRGNLTVELYQAEAPKTVAHFLALVRKQFYDGMRFHRVENYPRPFLVQTGDPLSKTGNLDDPRMGTGGSGSPVPFEKNSMQFLNGTLGLVRDLKDPDSGDSQFFICNGNQRFLEGTYVAFGRVTKGLEIIPKIQRGDRILSIRELRE